MHNAARLLVMQAATGIDVTHVPYKGSAPALIDIVAGQIQAMHTSVLSAEAHIKGDAADPTRQAPAGIT